MKSNLTILLTTLLLLACACGGGSGEGTGMRPKGMSNTPTSIRGWVDLIEPVGAAPITDPNLVAQRQAELIADTSVSVKGLDFASGGVNPSGAFIVLDVPPNRSVIEFNAPGAQAELHLEGIPPYADVLVPYIALKNNKVVLLRPDRVQVRVPSSTNQRKRLSQFATVEGLKVPVWEVPITDLADRRDFPDPHNQSVIPMVR